MDIELIIKRVAEEVYNKIRTEEQGGGVRQASCEKWIMSRMQTNMSIDEVKKACEDVKSSKAKTLCIPQWFVSYAAEQLKGSGVKVATAVGLPGGSTSSFAKYAEAKQAVIAGAEAVLVPVNMQLCAVGDWGGAKNDLAESMAPCKGKTEVYAMVEVDTLSCDQIGNVAEMCSACGVDTVLLSAVVSGRVSDQQVQAVKQKGVATGVYGGVTQSTQPGYQQAGACCFAASRC